MRSDLSEHYCCVQKGMENHIRVIWTHKLFSNCPNLQIILRYCYDLNFAVNRKGENVLEHSRTGSRTPTSGTGRGESTRGGEKDIKVEPTP
jgi:hypothetical protein